MSLSLSLSHFQCSLRLNRDKKTRSERLKKKEEKKEKQRMKEISSKSEISRQNLRVEGRKKGKKERNKERESITSKSKVLRTHIQKSPRASQSLGNRHTTNQRTRERQNKTEGDLQMTMQYYFSFLTRLKAWYNNDTRWSESADRATRKESERGWDRDTRPVPGGDTKSPKQRREFSRYNWTTRVQVTCCKYGQEWG